MNSLIMLQGFALGGGPGIDSATATRAIIGLMVVSVGLVSFVVLLLWPDKK